MSEPNETTTEQAPEATLPSPPTTEQRLAGRLAEMRRQLAIGIRQQAEFEQQQAAITLQLATTARMIDQLQGAIIALEEVTG